MTATTAAARAVSVLICTRDRPELAAGAVANALGQATPDLEVEVVVVDHASDPPFTLSTTPDRPVRVVRVGPDLTLGEVRNVALAEARHELVAFLDDDDRFRPGKLALQSQLLSEAPPAVAAVESGFDLWDRGRLVRRYVPATGRDLAEDLLRVPRLQPSTVLLRRSAVATIGGFDPELQRNEDWELWLRLTDRFDVLVLPRVLTDRWHNPKSPAARLVAYVHMTARLAPRVDRLPPDRRRRVAAHHGVTLAILEGDAGRRRSAARRLVGLWRERPWDVRPLLRLARLAPGPTRWRALADALRWARHGFATRPSAGERT